MAPLPWRVMWRAAAWAPKNVPLRLMSRVRCQVCSSSSSAGMRAMKPALLTQMSSTPYCCATASASAREAAGSATSRARQSTSWPDSRMA
ncbi:Uncharacterised protein [Bordetella pertussis]|nr:Uncharacterised protein [Bordetella pertussis]